MSTTRAKKKDITTTEEAKKPKDLPMALKKLISPGCGQRLRLEGSGWNLA
jgi:hypothetical protein